MGRTDKGILITTGVFSKSAQDEAKRDGALMIDLIDGLALVAKLKELGLGVQTIQKINEEVQIDSKWFDDL